MSYDDFLDRCHDDYYGDESDGCTGCADDDCDCEDVDFLDDDDDDYEVCFDHETGSLEVVR